MRIFKITSDVYYFGYLVFKKDDIIKFESDEYIVEDSNVKFPLRIIDVLNDRRFIEIDILLDYSFDTKEVSEDDDLKIKKYRIELDVVTSKKKLKEIENFIKNNIENLL